MDNLARILLYILGWRPDEFGIVPDRQGFVGLKELLQAFHEEEGWSYVRQSHINEVLLGKDRGLFELEGKRIRATETHWRFDFENPPRSLPKVLFTAVRRRAHPVVMEKGLRSVEDRYLALASDADMALRMGRRRDQEPVLLEVLASAAEREGVQFYPFGMLFLCHRIPEKFISGPPVSQEAIESRSAATSREEKMRHEALHVTPGSFILDISRDPDPYRRAKGRKRKGWKETSRKLRRGKRP